MSTEQEVWNKAKQVRDRDPNQVRQDPYGNEIHRHEYGKDTRHGWVIDHILPKSQGG